MLKNITLAIETLIINWIIDEALTLDTPLHAFPEHLQTRIMGMYSHSAELFSFLSSHSRCSRLAIILFWFGDTSTQPSFLISTSLSFMAWPEHFFPTTEFFLSTFRQNLHPPIHNPVWHSTRSYLLGTTSRTHLLALPSSPIVSNFHLTLSM